MQPPIAAGPAGAPAPVELCPVGGVPYGAKAPDGKITCVKCRLFRYPPQCHHHVGSATCLGILSGKIYPKTGKKMQQRKGTPATGAPHGEVQQRAQAFQSASLPGGDVAPVSFAPAPPAAAHGAGCLAPTEVTPYRLAAATSHRARGVAAPRRSSCPRRLLRLRGGGKPAPR